MKSSFLKRAVPHLIAVGIFLVIAIVYCQPAFEGKVVNQHDVLGWKGMAQQSFEYKEKYGHFPLWTNSMFGGMPAYQIAMDSKHQVGIGIIYPVLSLWLPKPVNYFFLACICFYFLCMVLRIRPWMGIVAAIGFAYSTFDIVIVSAGHDTQIQALALAPAVIGSMFILFQRRFLLGTALVALFSGLQIGTGHLQIVYYTILLIGLITVFYLIHEFRQKRLSSALGAIALAAVAGIIGFAACAVTTFPTYDYAKETMRGGKSELTGDQKNKTKGGLDKDYAFQWSYGIGETFTLIVPGTYGGSNGGREHASSSHLIEKGLPEESALAYANHYSYWGDQPFTSGPVYLGAVICFLFIFGMIYVKSWHKWWILSASLLGIFMAWGGNFSAFNYFLFDYLPFYSKFRAPAMSLVLPQIGFPLLGALAIEQLLSDQSPRAEIWKKLKLSVFFTAGLFAVLGIFYLTAEFKSPKDVQLRNSFAQQISQSQQPSAEAQQQATQIVSALREDRKSLFAGDLLRSFILVGLTIILLGAYIKNKLKPLPLLIGLLVLTSFDLLAIGRRYLNNESFVEPDEFMSTLSPTAADQQILADPNKPFRVYDETEDPFQSSRASYFHNSIGGYHPAKLGLYQDLIEHQLAKGNMQVYNMLNTKYFIMVNPANRQPVAQINPNAFGPAWLVKGIKYVKNADEEMKALDSTNLRDTAVVQEQFKPLIKILPQFDSTASIRLVENLNDTVRYDFNAASGQFAVFSEIYYPRGWNAYLDGNKTDYVKADYALRGMSVPAGKHKIEFRFEPRSYDLGNTITLIAALLVYGLLAVAIFMEIKKKKPSPQS